MRPWKVCQRPSARRACTVDIMSSGRHGMQLFNSPKGKLPRVARAQSQLEHIVRESPRRALEANVQRASATASASSPRPKWQQPLWKWAKPNPTCAHGRPGVVAGSGSMKNSSLSRPLWASAPRRSSGRAVAFPLQQNSRMIPGLLLNHGLNREGQQRLPTRFANPSQSRCPRPGDPGR